MRLVVPSVSTVDVSIDRHRPRTLGRRMRALIFAALLAGCTTAQTASDPSVVTAAPVIAAERAFAARAGEIGWIPAFREFTASDAQQIGQNGIESAPETLAATPDDNNKLIYWAPEY